MSADNSSSGSPRKPFGTRSAIDAMLDFGPDTHVAKPNENVTQRLAQLVNKIKEINDRIDKLASRF